MCPLIYSGHVRDRDSLPSLGPSLYYAGGRTAAAYPVMRVNDSQYALLISPIIRHFMVLFPLQLVRIYVLVVSVWFSALSIDRRIIYSCDLEPDQTCKPLYLRVRLTNSDICLKDVTQSYTGNTGSHSESNVRYKYSLCYVYE